VRLFAVVVFLGAVGCKPTAPPPAPPGPQLAWVFEAPRPGTIIAAPCVTPDAIYLAATQARGFDVTGAVYALDPATGRRRWTFDRDGWMLPSASTPLVAGGRLYVGEGMHGHTECRLQCLDPATGKALWEARAADHVEGGPATFGDLVIFPAGNDGLRAVNAGTGQPRWAFRGDVHIDSTPSVAGDRVYVGGGKSRRFQNYQVICLEAAIGKPVWRAPVSLPAWGNPVVAGGRVYIGLGNGRLTESAAGSEKPAGALACLDAADGKVLWSFGAGNAVFGRPTVIGDRVIVGSRDGNLYGLTPDGREAFRVPMGGPVVAGVTAAGGRVYAVSVAGRIVCVEPADGEVRWAHELGRPGVTVNAFGVPVVAGRRLYVAAEMTTDQTGIVTLFGFDLPAGEGGGL
jgi:outer membrane protein assembly factor BamB